MRVFTENIAEDKNNSEPVMKRLRSAYGALELDDLSKWFAGLQAESWSARYQFGVQEHDQEDQDRDSTVYHGISPDWNKYIDPCLRGMRALVPDRHNLPGLI